MEIVDLAKQLGIPVSLAVLGVWALVSGRVIARPSHDAIVANCTRELANLKEAHARELATLNREIVDRDRRLELAGVTETRLIEMALRSTAAGEKIGSAAKEAVDRIAIRSTDQR